MASRYGRDTLEGRVTLLRKGAEADIYLRSWHGHKIIVKERVRKSYRLDEIDTALRSSRTVHEAQLIHEAKRSGVPTPTIYQVDKEGAVIAMEYVEGRRLKELLAESAPRERVEACRKIGEMIARLHKRNIIHGDLTTSNMIAVEEGKVFLIDFGLGFFSDKLEDRGVDLHLIKRALNSTHHRFFNSCYRAVREGYARVAGEERADAVFKKVNEVEKRGRYSERA
ncbi:MAG: KEOPS complex kinase/ATPase Bud32 [Candidatus Bathyarchaeia archaeon]